MKIHSIREVKTIAIIIISLFAYACARPNANVLTIGASAEPHARILSFIKDDYKRKGYVLRIIEFDDYAAANISLMEGEIDANFLQHNHFLSSNIEWQERLVPVFDVHVEPFALYSTKYKDISELPDGAVIATPNNAPDCERAWKLLAENGLIQLREISNNDTIELDIDENPHNYRFVSIDANQLVNTLKKVDAACIQGNYALNGGLSLKDDALLIESVSSPYSNVLVVSKGAENDPRISALEQVVRTSKVRNFIEKTWPLGSVIAVF